MAFQNYSSSNLAQGALDASLLASGTSFALKSGQGNLFPTSFPFLGLFESFDEQGRVTKQEIVKVTNRVGDVLTCVRSFGYCPADYSATTQTNTAFSFSSGDTFSHVVTAEQQKDVQDELARLETDKLNKSGGATRTGLTAKRVLVTDPSGNETQLSGTSGQVVWFDAGGAPVATTPSTDINGLSAVTSLIPTDEFIIYSPTALANRKILQRDALGIFGDGSDGDLTVSAGTTTLSATNGQVFKQYRNLTISGGTLECAGEFNHIYVSGTFTVSSGFIHADGKGWTGGGTSANGTAGKDLFLNTKFTAGNLGATASAATATGWTSVTFSPNNAGWIIRISSGGGGGGGGSWGSTTAGVGGNGGNGGGVIVIVANSINITGWTLSADGLAGSNGTAGVTQGGGGAGGGGGGGGSFVIIYGNSISNAGTKRANGWNGGNGANGAGNFGVGGSGGSGAGGYATAGWNGGAQNVNGVTASNNSYGTGGTWGAKGTNATIYVGGGGGGGAPGLVYTLKAKIA